MRGPKRHGTLTTNTEAAIMDLYDAGSGPAAIAAELGLNRKTVQRILGYLGPNRADYWATKAAKGSAALVAAIRHHHPEKVRS